MVAGPFAWRAGPSAPARKRSRWDSAIENFPSAPSRRENIQGHNLARSYVVIPSPYGQAQRARQGNHQARTRRFGAAAGSLGVRCPTLRRSRAARVGCRASAGWLPRSKALVDKWPESEHQRVEAATNEHCSRLIATKL